jgi:hypothetical protein
MSNRNGAIMRVIQGMKKEICIFRHIFPLHGTKSKQQPPHSNLLLQQEIRRFNSQSIECTSALSPYSIGNTHKLLFLLASVKSPPPLTH